MTRYQLGLLGRGLCAAIWSGLLLPVVAHGHVGAPYPVLIEQTVGAYTISALADPDVGVGTFLIEATLSDAGPVPVDTVMSVAVRPQDDHTAGSSHQAVRQVTRQGERFIGKVPFDARGTWVVVLEIAGSAGRGEISFDVEVTPPYPGVLTTLACLLPFAALGGLWVAGALRSRDSRMPQTRHTGSERTGE